MDGSATAISVEPSGAWADAISRPAVLAVLIRMAALLALKVLSRCYRQATADFVTGRNCSR